MTDLDIVLGILSVAAWVAGASLLGIGIGEFIIWGARKERGYKKIIKMEDNKNVDL